MRNVLIIEDDDSIAQLYNIVFTKRGYATQLAADGEAGLDMIQQQKPDIILLDMMMPKLNGRQVMQRLKESDQWKSIPVFVLSNLAEPEVESDMMKAGALQFVIKSQMLPDDIVTMVDDYFKSTAA